VAVVGVCVLDLGRGRLSDEQREKSGLGTEGSLATSPCSRAVVREEKKIKKKWKKRSWTARCEMRDAKCEMGKL